MSDAVLSVSDQALELILESRKAEPSADTLALWVEISGEAAGSYTYDLWFQPASEAGPNETVEHHEGIDVVVGPSSVDKLRGARLDVSAQGGMVIDNPNRPAAPARPAAPPISADLSDPIAQRIHEMLINEVNPAIASHGGQAELAAFEDGIVYVRLSGGCQGCAMSAMTLQQGIATMLREQIPEVLDVKDVTDHASGQNPYYENAH